MRNRHNPGRRGQGRGLVCLLMAAILFLPLFAKARETPITLLIYLCGSDLETKGSAASLDIEEMLQSLPGPFEARVLLMAGGANAWHREGINAQETAIFRLSEEGLVQEQTLGFQSMGEAQTLGFFLEYGFNKHPAERFALILWDHGAGPLMGVCFDERVETASGWDSLSLSELRQALSTSPFATRPLMWIGFDACLMASLEVAQALAPYAGYLIASQEVEPVSGWHYEFIKDISKDEDGSRAGQRIVDSYYAKEGESLAPVTLSCIDLSKIKGLTLAMDGMFGRMGEGLSETAYQTYTLCRADSKMVAGAASFVFDLVDLRDYVEMLAEHDPVASANVLQALDEAIVYNRANTNYLNGLSLYSPYENPGLYRDSGKAFLEGSSAYGAFARGMAEIWQDKAIIDWSALASLNVNHSKDGVQISLPLAQQQAQGLRKAKLRVFRKVSDTSYAYLHTAQDYTLDFDYALQFDYRHQALFMVDPAGQRLAGPLTYFEQDEALLLYGVLSKEFFEGPEDIMPARLEYRRDAQGAYQLAGVREVTGNPALQGKSWLQLRDWYEVQVTHGVFKPAYDSLGRLLPVNQWVTDFDLVTYQSLPLQGSAWSPRFLPLEETENIYLMLEITDIQNRVICTDLIPLGL